MIHTAMRASLDDKLAERKEKDPKFKVRLRKAAEALLPLAETDDGKVTMTSLCVAAGLTQAELAQKTNSKQPNISAL